MFQKLLKHFILHRKNNILGFNNVSGTIKDEYNPMSTLLV